MHIFSGYAFMFMCVYVSARAKVLTSIKYTITLYMYINMRNRGYSRDLRKGVSLCKGCEEKMLEKFVYRVLDTSLKPQRKLDKIEIDIVDKFLSKGCLGFRLAGEQNNPVVVDASERICRVFGFEMRGVLLG